MNTATLTLTPPPATLAEIGGKPSLHVSARVQARVLDIILATADEFCVAPGDLIGRARQRPIATARHAAIAIIRIRTRLSTVQIGYVFDDRDHGTILNSIIAAADLYAEDSDFRESYSAILARFPRIS